MMNHCHDTLAIARVTGEPNCPQQGQQNSTVFFLSKDNFEGYSLAVLQIWGHLETGRFSCLSILVRHRGKIEQNNRLAT
jgi:hypothetical protein